MEVRAGKRSGVKAVFLLGSRARKRVLGVARGEEDGVRAVGK